MAPMKATKKVTAVTKKVTAVTKKSTPVVKAMKDKSDLDGTPNMTLQEKLALWKSGNDSMNESMDLARGQQKQLAGQFQTALAKAPQSVKDTWDTASSTAAGSRAESKRGIVKAWLLDKTWGDTFVSHVMTISTSKMFKTEEKPVSRKELEMKYTDDEIDELLDSGALVPVKHSNKGTVTMFLDHSN